MTTPGLDYELHAGRIEKETLVWREGLGDWTRAGDLPELELLLAAAAQARTPRPPPFVRAAPAATALEARPATRRAGHAPLDIEALFADLVAPAPELVNAEERELPWASAVALLAQAPLVEDSTHSLPPEASTPGAPPKPSPRPPRRRRSTPTAPRRRASSRRTARRTCSSDSRPRCRRSSRASCAVPSAPSAPRGTRRSPCSLGCARAAHGVPGGGS